MIDSGKCLSDGIKKYPWEIGNIDKGIIFWKRCGSSERTFQAGAPKEEPPRCRETEVQVQKRIYYPEAVVTTTKLYLSIIIYYKEKCQHEIYDS